MSLPGVHPGTRTGGPSSNDLSAGDLAELMSAFNEVTSKLEHTHAQLRGEVRRLSAELREANEALQRSKRLAALGEMAAGIAHEVRNPLGSIGLYARMLEEDLGDRPDSRSIAGKIGSAVRGLDAVVGDVLSFARELRVRPEPCTGDELLERARDATGAASVGEVVIEPASDVAFECDTQLIHQALLNLLRNASDANSASGGTLVRLSARRGAVDPDDADPVPGVVLSVRDEGDGFPAGAFERAFNPFFTTRAAGTGLGLPIVHRIADAHGGRVTGCNNDVFEPGSRGATVALRLPIRVVSAVPEIVVRPSSSAMGGLVFEGSHG